jgi:hypothetical protein
MDGTLVAANASIEERGGGVSVSVFGAAIFLGAGLGFLLQPMAAKLVLPLFGGSPAVWTTSMVFYQGLLLAAYAFAHVSTRVLGVQRQPLAQAAVLAASLAALPIARHLPEPAPGGSQTFALLTALTVGVGAPFFVVATASPLLQRWFAGTRHQAGGDPYFLYAASNAGSLLALLAYPFAVEPFLTLDQQRNLWTGLFLAFALLLVGCWVLLARDRRPSPEIVERRREQAAATSALGMRTRARWMLMAFVPSSLMLGVTTHISTDVAAVPLLWVLPLAVYLLTFILAFARRPLAPARVAAFLPLLAIPVALNLVGVFKPAAWIVVLLHLALLFGVGALAHGRLAEERPAADRLTEFFLLLAVGGVLGGVFNAIVSPLVFDAVIEYPLVLALALALRAPFGKRPSRFFDLTLPLVLAAAFVAVLAGLEADATAERAAALVAAGGLLLLARRPVGFALGAAAILAIAMLTQGGGMHVDRTFFGVLRVVETAPGRHTLVHGTTVHGVQDLSSRLRSEPLSYFARSGPIGDVFRLYSREFRHVDVVGLGVGSLAAYGRPGQSFTFYEIDPGVVEIAFDPTLFTFVHDSPAAIRVVVGDGRRSLDRASAHSSDLLVVDAFSSDAIPVHLLTREAVSLYVRRLRPDGLLAFHISNRHLDLAPVIASVAETLGLAAVERVDRDAAAAGIEPARSASHWVVLARSPARLRALRTDGWKQPARDPGRRPWTDDFSNVLDAVRWRR